MPTWQRAKDRLAEIARRKTWEREHLRDGMRGHFRVDPASPFVPSEDTLQRALFFLRQGGRESEARPFASALRRPDGLAVVGETRAAEVAAGRVGMDAWSIDESRAAVEAGVDVLSVATDTEFLAGAPALLPVIRQSLPLPVLRRDFAVDELDLAISAALGADAVAITVGLLGPNLEALVRLCQAYVLDAVVEVGSERELDFSMIAGSEVVLLRSDGGLVPESGLEEFRRLAARIPQRHLLVANSALNLPDRAAQLRQSGADAILGDVKSLPRSGVGLEALRGAGPGGYRPVEWRV